MRGKFPLIKFIEDAVVVKAELPDPIASIKTI